MSKITGKIKRTLRVRKSITGTTDRPRISIHRTNKHIYAQVVNDESGKTLLGVSSKAISAKGTKADVAKETGKLLAEKAKGKGVSKAVFERGSAKYHGRVKALAEGAREGGLEF